MIGKLLKLNGFVVASDEAKKVVETAVAGKKGEKETKKPAGMNN